MAQQLFKDFYQVPGLKFDVTKLRNDLTKVLKQIATHIKNEGRYKSPWNFLPNKENETLKNEGYLTSDDGSMLFLLINKKFN